MYIEMSDVTDPYRATTANGHQPPPPVPPLIPPVMPPMPVMPPPPMPPPNRSMFARPESEAPAGPGPTLRVLTRLTDGRAVTGATLTLLDSAGRQVSRADSDGEGVGEFFVVGDGEYLLVLRHEGHLPQARTLLMPKQPAPAVDLEVVLAGAARLSGTVSDVSGRRLAGALVTLTGPDGSVAGTARTDEDGRYELVDLTVEQGTLAVFAPATRPVAIPVVIPPGERVRQDVEVSGSSVIAGVARTPEGWLIADARVSLHSEGREIAVTRTDADGQYSFSGVLSGAYTVIAVGYPPAQTEVVAGSGATTAEPLTLGHAD